MKSKEEYIMDSVTLAKDFVSMWLSYTPIDERVYNPKGTHTDFEMIEILKEEEPRYFKYLLTQFSVA